MSRDDYGLSGGDIRPQRIKERDAARRQQRENVADKAKEDAAHKSEKRDSMDGAPPHIWVWRILKPLLTIVISLGIVSLCIWFAYNTLYDRYFSPVDPKSDKQIEVVIKSGSSLSSISKQLEDMGLIKSAKVFKYYVDFSDMSSKVKAGTFVLSPSMSFDDIINVIKKPNEMSAIVKITLREGLTVEQMADVIIAGGVDIDKQEFLRLCRGASEFASNEYVSGVMSTVNSTQRKYMLEGYLFPDTYEFYQDAAEKDIVSRLLSRFGEIMTEDFAKQASDMGYTVDQILTLASMIEKEAKTDDFTRVSAVFHSRLKEGWTLGSDATIQYFVGGNDLVFTDAELAQDSLYNTYLYTGLPLGPICNPSRAAIVAALNPDEATMKEGYMYFCLGDPATGEIVYSKTLEEHEAAVAQYEQLWREYDAALKAKAAGEDGEAGDGTEDGAGTEEDNG